AELKKRRPAFSGSESEMSSNTRPYNKRLETRPRVHHPPVRSVLIVRRPAQVRRRCSQADGSLAGPGLQVSDQLGLGSSLVDGGGEAHAEERFSHSLGAGFADGQAHDLLTAEACISLQQSQHPDFHFALPAYDENSLHSAGRNGS